MASMLRSAVSRVAPRLTSPLARPTATSLVSQRLSLVQRPTLPLFASRSISSSPLLSQATAAAAAADTGKHTKAATKHHEHVHEPTSVSEYIDRFGGWYPLLGLGTFVLLSKELLVLNEEALMVTNFAAFVFISWLVAGDTINEAVAAKKEAIRKNHDDVSELYIESLEQVIRAGENSLALQPLLRSLKAEYSQLGEQVIKAKEMKARAAAREAVLSRLSSVYQKEQSEKAKYFTNMLDEVVDEVQERVTNMSQQDKDAIMDSAIRQLSGATEEGEDRLTKLYQEVLNAKFETA